MPWLRFFSRLHFEPCRASFSTYLKNIYNKLESNPGPFAPQEISLTTKPFKEATATLLVSHQVAHGPDDDHGDVHRDHDLHPRRRNSRLKREQKLSVSLDRLEAKIMI